MLPLLQLLQAQGSSFHLLAVDIFDQLQRLDILIRIARQQRRALRDPLDDLIPRGQHRGTACSNALGPPARQRPMHVGRSDLNYVCGLLGRHKVLD